jgi:outer membrane lipopolysaccharide assembly protein LptE/RlpB
MHKLLVVALVAAGLGLGGCSHGAKSTTGERSAASAASVTARDHYEFRVNKLARELRASGRAKDWEEAKKIAQQEIGYTPPPPLPSKRTATRALTTAEMDRALGKTPAPP